MLSPSAYGEGNAEPVGPPVGPPVGSVGEAGLDVPYGLTPVHPRSRPRRRSPPRSRE